MKTSIEIEIPFGNEYLLEREITEEEMSKLSEESRHRMNVLYWEYTFLMKENKALRERNETNTQVIKKLYSISDPLFNLLHEAVEDLNKQAEEFRLIISEA